MPGSLQDQQLIRELIERWVAAIRSDDLEGVEQDPDLRLRVTVGLVKRDGRGWSSMSTTRSWTC
ncbi:hypothetical protein [Nakamurella leprariae]|uniref:Uncharacterized protein n=1 Tax=Nakamurella leprariae TaxID=2803911 RepID=A0A939C106_9ACTN|nr:hypothetical protein [Nakamurella leprariae]MBM9469316.1 hypothetical protein [Nakamurella leprariae]